MGNCFGDVAGGQQVVGEGFFKGVSNGRLETMEAVEKVTAAGYVVQLSFSASKLRHKDIFSKSDPMLVVCTKRKDGVLEEVGRTEVLLNSEEPKWITEVTMMYNFEEIQPLVVKVYNIDTKFSNIPSQKLKLGDQSHLGELECLLSEILTTRSQTFTKDLRREKGQLTEGDSGSLTIRAEELVRSKFLVTVGIAARGLENKDFISRSDPFLIISRLREDGSTIAAFRTEVIKNNSNPEWKPIKVTLSQLCDCDKDCPLKIDCLSYNDNGKAQLIGQAQLSLNQIEVHALEGLPIDLQRKSYGPQNYIKNAGTLHVRGFSIEPYFSFLDYVLGGHEINFMAAVDFTASNGSPRQPDSLHFADPSGKPNAYQSAILAVGEVLQYYDTDKRFPAWGFGGRPIDGPVSHCFALNGSQHSAEVDAINGILHAYSQALRNVALAGPTLFAPVINMAASIASSQVHQEKYFVLLIITDGVICDQQETVNALVKASHLPLSVLIVGVGGADFTEMEILDADKKRLATADGRLATRDIVQFVPMRDLTKGSELARELLAELPHQFLEYMTERKIVPGTRPPPPAQFMDLV